MHCFKNYFNNTILYFITTNCCLCFIISGNLIIKCFLGWTCVDVLVADKDVQLYFLLSYKSIQVSSESDLTESSDIQVYFVISLSIHWFDAFTRTCSERRRRALFRWQRDQPIAAKQRHPHAQVCLALQLVLTPCLTIWMRTKMSSFYFYFIFDLSRKAYLCDQLWRNHREYMFSRHNASVVCYKKIFCK